jgi:hypothetical protein
MKEKMKGSQRVQFITLNQTQIRRPNRLLGDDATPTSQRMNAMLSKYNFQENKSCDQCVCRHFVTCYFKSKFIFVYITVGNWYDM